MCKTSVLVFHIITILAFVLIITCFLFIFSILHSLLMTSKSAQMTSGIIETLLQLSESKSIVSMELLSQCIKILSTRTLVTSDILTHGKLLKLVANTIRNLSEENVKSTSKPDENQTKGKMLKNSLSRNKRLMLDEMTS